LLGREDGKFQEGDIATVPAKKGSIILFSGTMPHRSINSSSKNVRWSCDFRFHKKTAKRPGKSENDWFFGMKEALQLRDGAGKSSKKRADVDWKKWAAEERNDL
jgi:ectoine hydroxylase-related dioxygenase (phytanoyl-CoA dioxygenase family)